MTSLSRRTILTSALTAATSILAGCGGSREDSTSSSEATQSPSPSAPPPAPPPTGPSWAARAASGTWTEVPMGNTLASVNPINDRAINPNFPLAPEWAPNENSFENVVASWCGASFNEAKAEMWLGIHGGHTDYAGNEILACDYSSESPAWRMVRKPSGAIGNQIRTDDGLEASGVYADGRPRSIHTAGKWCYVPGVGPALMVLGAGAWQPTRGGKNWSVFVSESTGEASFTSLPAWTGTVDNSGACFDSRRNAIWVGIRNKDSLLRYDVPASGAAHTGSYSNVGSGDPGYGNQNLCYIPGHDCILHADSFDDDTNSRWRVFDCATGLWHKPAFNGPLLGPLSVGTGQLRWVPSLGAACFWDNQTRTTLITKVKPGANPRTDPWTISSLPVNSSNVVSPTPRAAHGTFGRFAYSALLGGFLLFNSTTGPTYFYKI